MRKSINRRRFLANSLLVSGGHIFGKNNHQEPIKPSINKKPNLLFVFSDQQHAKTLNCYGNSFLQTPSLNKLADAGCQFENAISTYPVCSPYRGMLISGRFPLNNGVIGNDTPIHSNLPTIGKIFKNSNYKTGYIGKWHLESSREPFVPVERRQGFDYWAVHNCSHKHFDNFYYKNKANEPVSFKGYEPEHQTELAVDFIEKTAQSKDPFCLFISFGPPHDPYKAPSEYETRFPWQEIPMMPNRHEREIVDNLLAKEPTSMPANHLKKRKYYRALIEDETRLRKEVLVGYYAACEALDDCMGRLLKCLERLQIAEDTIVVYTSDHGDLVGAHHMISKQSPFEESINVPFLIRYPKKIEPNQKTNALLSPVDILPTLLSLANIEVDGNQFDGKDLSSACTGNSKNSQDSIPLMKMIPGGNPWIANGILPWRGVRTERYVYAEMEDEPWILYDLQNDPYQLENRVSDSAFKGLLQDLKYRNEELKQATGDTFSQKELIHQFKQQRKRYPGYQRTPA